MPTIRRHCAAAAVALCLAAAPPLGATPARDAVINALQEQGYSIVLVHWTLLGRIRIVANSPELHREIVINPTTGAVLRDYWVATDELAARMAAARITPDNDSSAPRPTVAGDDARGGIAADADIDSSAIEALSTLSSPISDPAPSDAPND